MGKLGFFLVVVCLCLVCFGCGAPSTKKAGGSVSVDGKPVSAGLVVFYPTDGGRQGSGMIKEDGTFFISYKRMGDGLPPGEYKVTIVADKLTGKGAEKVASGDEEDAGLVVDTRNTKLIHIVPKKYNRRETTPLKVTVEDNDEVQNFPFDIDSKS